MPARYRKRRRYGRVSKRRVRKQRRARRSGGYSSKKKYPRGMYKIKTHRQRAIIGLGDQAVVTHKIVGYGQLSTGISAVPGVNYGNIFCNDMHDVENNWGVDPNTYQYANSFLDYQVHAMKFTVQFFPTADIATNPCVGWNYANQLLNATTLGNDLDAITEGRWSVSKTLLNWATGAKPTTVSMLLVPRKIIGGAKKLAGDELFAGTCNVSTPFYVQPFNQIPFTFGVSSMLGALPANKSIVTFKVTVNALVKYWNKRETLVQ